MVLVSSVYVVVYVMVHLIVILRHERASVPDWLLLLLVRSSSARDHSIPDLQERVPRPSRNGHSIVRHAQAADSVIVSGQNSCSQNMIRIRRGLGWRRGTDLHAQLSSNPRRCS